MNLNLKMKNLENKYIDLANFYKRELLNQKTQTPDGIGDYDDVFKHRHHYNLDTHSSSQNRSRSPYSKNQILELDQNVERNIINELLQEKSNLEKELENMVFMEERNQDRELEIQQKIQILESENIQLRELLSKQNQHPKEIKTPTSFRDFPNLKTELKLKQEQIIEKFEDEFIEFINNNYNSFTENDVVGMFGSLRSQLISMVDLLFQTQPKASFQFSREPIENPNIDILKQSLEQLKEDIQQLTESYKVTLGEFEIQHEYLLQGLNKSVFDLKNKQDMAKLDIKKLGLTLSSLSKTNSELTNSLNDNSKKSTNLLTQTDGGFIHHERGSSGFRKPVDSRMSLQNTFAVPMSPMNQNIQIRLSRELVSQVSVMNQTMSELLNKMNFNDQEIKNLTLFEEKSLLNISQMKQNFDHFVESLQYIMNREPDQFIRTQSSQPKKYTVKRESIDLNTNHNSTSEGPLFGDQSSLVKIEKSTHKVRELQSLNEQLQKEIQNSSGKFKTLLMENQRLQQENQNMRRNSISPHRQYQQESQQQHSNLFNYKSSQFDSRNSVNQQFRSSTHDSQSQEIYKLKQNLAGLEAQNNNLELTIRSLKRQVDEKSEAIERLQQEVVKSKSQSFQPFHRHHEDSQKNQVSSDMLIFYQKQADTTNEKMKNLITLTQKFLSSMKKLQKAVHRKEPSVSKEKTDFEQSRKNLEQFIKLTKRELEVIENKERDQNIPSGRENFSHTLNNDHGKYSSLVESKQNNSLNNQRKPLDNLKQRQIQVTNVNDKQTVYSSSVKFNPPVNNRNLLSERLTTGQSHSMTAQNAKSFNANNQYSISSNSLLQNQAHGHNMQDDQQYSTYHNLRSKNNSKERSPLPIRQSVMKPQIHKAEMFRSLEAVERRPFFQSIDKSQYRSPSHEKEALMSLDHNQRNQMSNLKSEVDLLKQEIEELISEREQLRKTINYIENEKENTKLEKSHLERQVERERKQKESQRREIAELEAERDSLLDEFRKLNMNYNHKGFPDKQTIEEKLVQDLQQEKLKFQEELNLMQKINSESKRTINFLEESAEVAKQTITDLKEALTSKDLELDDFKLKIQNKNDKDEQNKFLEKHLRNLKAQLLEQIDSISDQNEKKLKTLTNLLQQKEEKLNQLRTYLDKKLKEKEMRKVDDQEQEVKLKLSLLQAQIRDLENKGVSEEEIERLKREIQQKNKQLQELEKTHNQEKQQLEKQIQDKLKSEYEQYINEFRGQIEGQLAEQQQQLEEEIEELKREIEEKNNKLEMLDKTHSQEKKQLEKQISDYLKQQHEKEINDIREKIEGEVTEQLSQYEEEIEQYQRDIQQKNKEVEELMKTHNQQKKLLEKQINDQLKQGHEQNINELRTQIEEEYTEQQQLYEEEIQNLKSQYEQQIEALVTQHKSIEKDLNKNIKNCQEQVSAKDYELEQFQSKFQKDSLELITSNQNLKSQNNKLEKILSEKDKRNKEIQQQIQETQQQQENIVTELQQQLEYLQQNQNSDFEKQNQEIQILKEQHKKEKQQLEEQIRLLNKQVVNIGNEKAEAEAQVDHVKKQIGKEQGEVVKKKDEEIQSLKNKLQANKQSLEKLIAEKDNNIQDLSVNYQNLKAEFIQLQGQLETTNKQKQKEIQDKERQLKELQSHQEKEQHRVQSLLAEKDEEIQSLIHQRNQQIEEIMKQSANQSQGIQSQFELLKNQLNEKDHQLHELSTQVTQKEEELNTLQENFNSLQDEANNLQEEFNSELEAKDQQLDQYEQQIKALQTEKSGQVQYINTLTTQLQQKEEELRKLQQDLNEQSKLLTNNQKQELERIQAQFHSEKQKLEFQQLSLKEQLEQELSKAQSQIEKHKQTINDMSNENKFVKSLQQSLKNQIENIQKEMSEKEQIHSQSKEELEKQVFENRQKLSQKEKEINGLNEQISSLKISIQEKEEEMNKVNKKHEVQIQEMKQQVKTKESQIEQVHKDLDQMKESKDEQIKHLQEEKDGLYKQLNELINQSKFEKKSLEQNLQQQLNETLSHLQQKEKEILAKDEHILSLKQEFNDLQQKEETHRQEVEIYENQLQQMQNELDDAELQREKQMATLENSRNLIATLKNQMQIAMEKERQYKNEQQQITSNKEILEENDQLKKKLKDLKSDFDDRVMDLQMKIDEQDSELKIKTELIEEANKVIEEFNDEKHDIKAKFKHIMQVLDNIEEESSYREDEEINLEECFDSLEQVILKFKQSRDNQIHMLEENNSYLLEQQKIKEEEMEQLHTQMSEVKCELMNALNKCESNDMEMRRQMENAQRKIENYKEKLIEKQKYINTLENERKSDRKDDSRNYNKENMELLQKLQKAENELQTFRLASEKKFTPNESYREQTSKESIQKMDNIEDQMTSLRKQLFQAKDQVIQSLSDTFSRKFKELQQIYVNENILKKQLAELKDSNESSIISPNTAVKTVKKLSVMDRQLVIVQLMAEDKFYLIDENMLNQVQLEFLNSYMPENENDDMQFDQKQYQIMESLNSQIKELQEERREMKQELNLLKNKSTQLKPLQDIEEMRLEELEDELGHFTTENQELRLKLKDLSIMNSQLKLRVIELNQMIQESFTGKQSEQALSQKILKLMEENDDYKRQLSQRTTNRQQFEEDKQRSDEDPSFLRGMRPGHDHDNNIFDQSSIQDVIEGLGDEIPSSNRNVDQQRIVKLEQELDDVKQKYKNLTTEIQKSQNTLSPSEASVIEHIKGTLIQFLKNCPLTEKNNEELLAIVFSMMEFSKDEVLDVQIYRQQMKGSSQRGTEPDEEIKKSAKKGILNLFKKKSDESKQKLDSAKSTPSAKLNSSNGTSPMKPIKR